MKWQERGAAAREVLGQDKRVCQAGTYRPDQGALSFACMFQTTALPALARCTRPRLRLQAPPVHCQPRLPRPLAQCLLQPPQRAQWLQWWPQRLRLAALQLEAAPALLLQPALPASLLLPPLTARLPAPLPPLPLPPSQLPRQHAVVLLPRLRRAQQPAAIQPLQPQGQPRRLRHLLLLLLRGMRRLLSRAAMAGRAA